MRAHRAPDSLRSPLLATLKGKVMAIRTLISIVVSVMLFSALFFGVSYLTSYLLKHSQDFMNVLPWINGLVYALYFISGFVASIISRDGFLVTGSVAGFVSGLVAVIIFDVGVGISGAAITVFSGALLGLIGGGLFSLLMRLWGDPFNKKQQAELRRLC